MANNAQWTPTELLNQIEAEYAGGRQSRSKRRMLEKIIEMAFNEVWLHAPWNWRLRSLDVVTTSTEAYVDLPSDYNAAYIPRFLYDTTGGNKLVLRSRLQWTELERIKVTASNSRPNWYCVSSRDKNGTETQTLKLIATPDQTYTYRGFQYFALPEAIQFGSKVTYTGRPADGDTFTVNGRVYEFDGDNNGVTAGNVEIDNSGDTTLAADITTAIAAVNSDSSAIVTAFESSGTVIELRLKDAYDYETLAVSESGLNSTASNESAPEMPSQFRSIWYGAAARRMAPVLEKPSLYAQRHREYIEELLEAESMYDVRIIEGAPVVHQDSYQTFESMGSENIANLGTMRVGMKWVVL